MVVNPYSTLLHHKYKISIMRNSKRAQSETVGNVLLIGVVVVVATTAAVGIVFNFGGGEIDEETTRADIRASATTENLTLSHNGGDSLRAGDLEVILENDTAEQQFQVNTANLTGSDDRFDPGERFERAHGLNGTYIDVLVYIERADSSAVLLDTTVSTRE